MRRAFMTLLLLLLLPFQASAQERFEWFPGGTYDASIPTPESFLGYTIGDAFTWHHRIKAYLEAVDAASDRVTMRSYGRSVEGRELMLLTISLPENLERLGEVRRDMGRLADPRGAQQAELDRIIQESPAIAWLSYNVHGNESVSSEAAMQAVYQLAAGSDAVTTKILEELVVIIDPLLNPDGRDRYVHSYQKRRGSEPNARREAWEHSEDWPGSRSNHYFFDLNRDWAWQTQLETRLRIAEYLEWNPVVHVDFHEMGSSSSYFFFPADRPIHTSYPEVMEKWQEIYGRANASAFDRFGWPYYTRQTFDLYYPSYGDSWPSMMGAIGMTYEQGGGGSAGLALEREDDTVLTLRDRVHGHFTTSMATLRVTAEKRRERLADFLTFFRKAIEKGEGPVKGYALVPDTDPYNADRLVRLLRAQGIEVQQAGSSFRSRVAGGYGIHPAPERMDFPAGTYFVPLGQPKGVAVEVLMEPKPALEDTSFYDLSAWSLPLAFSVEAYALGETPGGLETVDAPPARTGSVEGGRAGYAYAIPYHGTSALLAANDLLNMELRVNVSGEEFTTEGYEFPAGTFLVPIFRNPETVHDRVARVVGERGVTAYALQSGLVAAGSDLGAGSYRYMRRPRIAVAGGEGLSSGAFGEVWHFLEERFPCFDYTNVSAERLGGLDLTGYDVLILPSDGSGRSYQRYFGEQGLAALRTWLRGGGTLIGFDGGAAFATEDVSGLTGVSSAGRSRGQRDEEAPSDQPAELARKSLEQQAYERRISRTPGGMWEVVLEPEHWMAFGMPERMAVLKRGTGGFALTERGVNVAVFSRDPLLSGYAAEGAPEEVSRKAWLIVESVGRGQVVLFADDPLYRMFVEGMHQLVLNAVILGPAF
ncbi:MAG: M14 family zinc carboxypeptidase [bacterium]